jgi:LuxR family maltose regulon positive regulatory protein
LGTHTLTVRSTFSSDALAPVERWVKENALGVDDSVFSLNREVATLIWARLLIAQKNDEEVLQLLERLIRAADAGGRKGHVIEALALTALAHETLGSSEYALNALQKALLLAEPEGYIRLFVDEGLPMAELLQRAASAGIAPAYTGRLLAAFTAERGYLRSMIEPSSPAPVVGGAEELVLSNVEGWIEPLSNRELEVLQLVAAGFTNHAIAQELSIAVSTVKTHMKNIHAKLGVRNRTQAAARARELNLLS